ncbi:unnamed protein product [Aureobasidium vineae]|uniref:F-box domain-containing protein n=1 Tax=Aureobasidium vineae TaxID=2773715 RepID=A0A9N8PC17_9PEZI|nr:unnamed protein product [Aureobasidium vineae]
MNLLDLPREIRDDIYTYLSAPSANKHTTNDGTTTTYNYTHFNLFLTNRQLYHEARRIFLEQNTFVKITTPFPQSRVQVASDGVPIVAEAAEGFSLHRLGVVITLPSAEVETVEDTFVIHIDDLGTFCDSWMYSAVEVKELNPHLALQLILEEPLAATALDESTAVEKKVLRTLQERLLHPFGRIKNLLRVEVTGVPLPDDTVIAEMERLMAIPLESPAQRLILATSHKDAGNVALKAGQTLSALEHYRKAWKALFIVVKGRHRKTHGEGYFEEILTEPPFEGQHGSMVAIVLRVRLVANTLLAYLNLHEWDTAVHIGMRTINMMRGGRDNLEPDEEASNGWIAGPEMGKIYYRTALAYKEMDDKYEARRLLKVAVLYLPRDTKVRELIAECALRLG